MRARNGMTLVEVLVAMTILSITLLGMAQVATAVSVRGRANDINAKRTAALQLEANKLTAVPYASLASWPTADKVLTHGTFSYTRKLRIQSQGSNRYTITIIVVPTSNTAQKDSVIFDRTLPATTSPLCTSC